MRIDRNTATIVTDRQSIIGIQRDFDATGMTGHRLIHAVVDDLGGKMVQRAFVNTANIHSGAFANRLQALQHLNGRRVIAIGTRG